MSAFSRRQVLGSTTVALGAVSIGLLKSDLFAAATDDPRGFSCQLYHMAAGMMTNVAYGA